MWTCGIDIATQQAVPATISSAIAAPGESPNGLAPSGARPGMVAAVTGAGGRAYSRNERANMAMPQPIPIHR